MQYSIDLHRKSQAQAKQIYRDIQQLVSSKLGPKPYFRSMALNFLFYTTAILTNS